MNTLMHSMASGGCVTVTQDGGCRGEHRGSGWPLEVTAVGPTEGHAGLTSHPPLYLRVFFRKQNRESR